MPRAFRTSRRTGKRYPLRRYSPAAQDYISEKIRYLKDVEGKSQEEAVAQAINMARARGYKVPERKRSNPGRHTRPREGHDNTGISKEWTKTKREDIWGF